MNETLLSQMQFPFDTRNKYNINNLLAKYQNLLPTLFLLNRKQTKELTFNVDRRIKEDFLVFSKFIENFYQLNSIYIFTDKYLESKYLSNIMSTNIYQKDKYKFHSHKSDLNADANDIPLLITEYSH